MLPASIWRQIDPSYRRAEHRAQDAEEEARNMREIITQLVHAIEPILGDEPKLPDEATRRELKFFVDRLYWNRTVVR